MNNTKLIFRILLLGLIMLFACSNKSSREIHIAEVTESKIPEFNITFPETAFEIEKTVSHNHEHNHGCNHNHEHDTSMDATVTNWILEGADENGPFMFFVAYNKVPEKLKEIILQEPAAIDIALQAMLAGSTTKLGGTDFSFTKISYEDFDGMESLCKVFDGNGLIKSRVFLIEDNLFMISAGGKQIDINVVDDFLNSFGLKDDNN